MPSGLLKHSAKYFYKGDLEVSLTVTISKGDHFSYCSRTSSNQLKASRAKTEVSEEETQPQGYNIKISPEFPVCCLDLQISDLVREHQSTLACVFSLLACPTDFKLASPGMSLFLIKCYTM